MRRWYEVVAVDPANGVLFVIEAQTRTEAYEAVFSARMEGFCVSVYPRFPEYMNLMLVAQLKAAGCPE